MNPWSFVNGASILNPVENREFLPVLQINIKYSTLNPKIKHQYLENVRSYSSIPCCFVSTIAFVRLAINLDSVLCVKVLFPLARISHLPKLSLQVTKNSSHHSINPMFHQVKIWVKNDLSRGKKLLEKTSIAVPLTPLQLHRPGSIHGWCEPTMETLRLDSFRSYWWSFNPRSCHIK